MAKKLTGYLSLTKIKKNLIKEYQKRDGSIDKSIFISVVPLQSADDKGNTHAITLYDKDTKEKIYLGRLKPEDFGQAQTKQAPTPAPQSFDGGADDDLPF